MNNYGKVIAFGGRTLVIADNIPKYINSPDSPIYHKSKVLYGLFQAKQEIKKKDQCYIVEGYTDVISLHKVGFENVVASGGTSLTKDQIGLINRFTNNIIILFDGDRAGVSASLRGIDLILELGLNVKVVMLPEKEDPDSYARKIGASQFKNYIDEHIEDFVTFKAKLLLSESEKDPIKRAETIQEILKSIISIPDKIKQSIFIKSCSRLLDIDEEVLISEQNRLIAKKLGKRTIARQVPISQVKIPFKKDSDVCERDIISLLVKHGHETINEEETLSEYVIKELDDLEFTNESFKKIIESYRTNIAEGNSLTHQYFVNSPDTELKNIAVNILSTDSEISINWEERLGIYTSKETDNLQKTAYMNILTF